MRDDDLVPETEPAGSLEPPSRKPPTALALGDAGSEPGDRPLVAITVVGSKPNWLGRFLRRAFDGLDEAADTVATALHIR